MVSIVTIVFYVAYITLLVVMVDNLLWRASFSSYSKINSEYRSELIEALVSQDPDRFRVVELSRDMWFKANKP